MWRQRVLLAISHLRFSPLIKSGSSCGPFLTASYSSSCPTFEATQLKSRSLVRIRGDESRPFLQGLITNDIGHLDSRPSLFTLFLNHQGRVLFDALLYGETTPTSDILLECDASFRSKLISHLKLYKLKRKVEIETEDKLRVWTIYDPSLSASKEDYASLLLTQGQKGYFSDPRLLELGIRILSSEVISPSTKITLQEGEDGYKRLRYTLGVGEGAKEIPFSNAFPLESNGDYLHGVSFHKGCYLGQELTARSHHTGVIRKRLMPFLVTDDTIAQKINAQEDIISSLQIINEKGRPVAKIRGFFGNIGIALFRVEDALTSSTLKLQDTTVQVTKPLWWPVEAAKEKQ